MINKMRETINDSIQPIKRIITSHTFSRFRSTVINSTMMRIAVRSKLIEAKMMADRINLALLDKIVS